MPVEKNPSELGELARQVYRMWKIYRKSKPGSTLDSFASGQWQVLERQRPALAGKRGEFMDEVLGERDADRERSEVPK